MSNHWDDRLWHHNIDFATYLAKKFFPPGHWLGPVSAAKAPSLYLTFDDGPDPKTTPALLEILAEEQVSATFFIIGAHAENHPDLLEQVARAGHTIGSHGFSHQALPTMAPKKMEDDVRRASESLTAITGTAPQFFRPPYGLLDARGGRYVTECGMKPVYWSVVTEDWLPIGAKRVVARVQRRLHNEALIVLHEKWFPQQTIQATREVIKMGKAAGYTFSALT